MVKKKTNKSRVKVGKLKVNKETVKDLSDDDAKKVKGGGLAALCSGHVTQAQQCHTSGYCDTRKDGICC